LVLERFDIDQPILIGHSDGASISLIAAASDSLDPLAVITIAAHIFVEQAGLDGVQAAKSNREQIVQGMSRHHDRPEIAFDRWSNIWLDPSFATFDIRQNLDRITCPLLVIQGDQDEYATPEMVHGVTQRVPHAVGKFIPDCGHITHKDQPKLLIDIIRKFLLSTGLGINP
jgi:Predicted hydrolases or acyltransferases (alpha/beta hydrolase superfamily)